MRRTTIEEFIASASSIHNSTYTYDKVVYINAHTKLTITCGTHGDFLQSPTNHLTGKGCPICAREANSISSRVYSTKPTRLYYIYFPELNLRKIGCTAYSIDHRFRREPFKYKVLLDREYTKGAEAYYIEKWLLKISIDARVTDKPLKGGNTELRTSPINNIVEEIKHIETIHHKGIK